MKEPTEQESTGRETGERGPGSWRRTKLNSTQNSLPATIQGRKRSWTGVLWHYHRHPSAQNKEQGPSVGRGRGGEQSRPHPLPGSSAAAERQVTVRGGLSQRTWGLMEGESREGFPVEEGGLGAGPEQAVRGCPPPTAPAAAMNAGNEAGGPRVLHSQLRGAHSAVISGRVIVPLCICGPARSRKLSIA